MDVEPEVETPAPTKSKKSSSSSSKKAKTVDAEPSSSKKVKKARNKVVAEEEQKSTKSKKKSSSSSSKKPEASPPSKKRKADSEECVVTTVALNATAKAAVEKKKMIDQNTPEKMLEWLSILGIRCDDKQLRAIKVHHNDMYQELFRIATNEQAKGLIYAYSVTTPIGRMFWYSPEEKVFKSAHSHLNLIRLKKYEKEALLNITTIKEGLTGEQRQKALACLGIVVAQDEEDAGETLKPEQWLFALIESGVLRRHSEKPDYKEKVEHCLLHDTEAKQTYWTGSKACKSKLNRIVVSRERAVTEKNIDAEYTRLLAKRTEIVTHLKKALTATTSFLQQQQQPSATLSTPAPIKKVKVPDAVVEKKQKPVAPLKKAVPKVPVTATAAAAKPRKERDEDSESTSTSSSFSLSDDDVVEEPIKEPVRKEEEEEEEEEEEMCEDKARLLETIRRKQALGHKQTTDPMASSLATSLQVSRNIEHCRKRQKLLQDDVEPEIKWFREECI